MIQINAKPNPNSHAPAPYVPAAHPPTNPIHVAVGVVPVYNRHGHLLGLLGIRRNLPGFGFNGLAFPGGYQDLGELLCAAAARETGEEAGLILDPAHFTLYDERPHSPSRQLTFCLYTGPKITLDQIEACLYDPIETSGLFILEYSDVLVFPHHDAIKNQFFQEHAAQQ